MTSKPIFIHSLFRTGSTYLWSTFRRNERFRCFYEPLHQEYVSMSTRKPSPWDFSEDLSEHMHFPPLDKSLTHEYGSLLTLDSVGLPLFKKSFSFDEYCLTGDNPDLKSYLDSLIENAGDKIPVLQFNRTPLRIRWFRRAYPEAVHIYLVRNPHDQFQSYVHMMHDKALDIFLVMDILTAGKNQEFGFFPYLAARVPLVKFDSREFADEYLVYKALNRCYSDWERYVIFYFMWFYSLFENAQAADFIVDMDALTRDPGYRGDVHERLKKAGIEGIDLSEASIQTYQEYVLEESELQEIERGVQAMILHAVPGKERSTFTRRISSELKDHPRIARKRWGLANEMLKKARRGIEAGIEGGSIWVKEPASVLLETSTKLRSRHDEFIERKKKLDALGNEVAGLFSRVVEKGRIASRKMGPVPQLDLDLMEINRELAKEEMALDKGKKIFRHQRPRVDGQDVRTATLTERFEFMRREFTRTTRWLEERIRSLDNQIRLLEEKTRLMDQKRRVFTDIVGKNHG